MAGLRARHDALMHAPSDGFGPPEIFHIRVDRTRRGRISARRAHRAHDLLRPSLPIRSRAAAKRHLMRRAIRGCQRLISSNQRRSSATVISSHQQSSAVISSNQRRSSAAVTRRSTMLPCASTPRSVNAPPWAPPAYAAAASRPNGFGNGERCLSGASDFVKFRPVSFSSRGLSRGAFAKRRSRPGPDRS